MKKRLETEILGLFLLSLDNWFQVLLTVTFIWEISDELKDFVCVCVSNSVGCPVRSLLHTVLKFPRMEKVDMEEKKSDDFQLESPNASNMGMAYMLFVPCACVHAYVCYLRRVYSKNLGAIHNCVVFVRMRDHFWQSFFHNRVHPYIVVTLCVLLSCVLIEISFHAFVI